MSWEESKNLLGVDNGKYRSMLGYAGESLAIGRALVCGYNLFFKAWRDAKYDAVLDSNGTLFRVEIKQTSGDSLSVTSGGRAGEQISRVAASREQILSTTECDFVIGVQSMNGHCWIIPVELIEIIERSSLNSTLLKEFYEKWGVFTGNGSGFSSEDIKAGFRNKSDDDLDAICTKLSIKDLGNYSIPASSRTTLELTKRNWQIYKIWQSILLV